MPGRSELVRSSFHFRSPSSASNRDCRSGIRISDVVRGCSLPERMARQSRAGAPASFVILGIGRVSVDQSQGLDSVRCGRVRGADSRSGPRRADRAIRYLRHCERGQSVDLGEHRSFVHGTSRWNTGAALDQGCIGPRADRHKRDVGCFNDWRDPTLVTRVDQQLTTAGGRESGGSGKRAFCRARIGSRGKLERSLIYVRQHLGLLDLMHAKLPLVIDVEVVAVEQRHRALE